MPVVDLVGGPRDGTTETVGSPWPRHMLWVNDGAGTTVAYLVQDGTTTADYYDVEANVPEDDPLDYMVVAEVGPEGPPGPSGPVGAAGPEGPPGQPWTARGDWDSATIYNVADFVHHEGAGYWTPEVSLNEEPPGAPWQLGSAEGPVGPQGPQGDQGPVGSPLPARGTAQIVTGALATGASEVGTIVLAKGYRILRLATDRAAWVRLYTTAAKRTADAGRAIAVDPSGDHGVVVEVITSALLLGLDLSPVPQGYSMEAVPANTIPYRITNLGAAGAVTVDLVYQAQEA